MFPRESPLPGLKILLAFLVVILVLLYVPKQAYAVLGLAAVAFGLLVVLWLVIVGTDLRSFFADRLAPRRTVRATVGRKWTRDYEMNLPRRSPSILAPVLNLFFQPTVTLYIAWVFWVSFDVGGREMQLSVPENIYIGLTEGAQGLLTYKGEKLIRFRPLPR